MANASFCLGYAYAATRFPWWISLIGGLFAYAIAGGLLIGLTPSAYPTLFLTIPSLWLIWRLFPTNMELSAAPSRSAGDLWARMIAGAVLVMVVTFAAPALGPRLSGILSGFPVLGCVLASSSHRVEGPEFVIRLLKGMVKGFYTMLFFIFTLAILLPEWGITHSFIMAFAIGTLIQIGMIGMKPFTLPRTGL